MGNEIELKPTDRQLLLYDIFKGCQQVELAEITTLLPIGRKMIQRDMKILREAKLIEVDYRADPKAYFVISSSPQELGENVSGYTVRKYRHLSKLNRIGRLMNELYTEEQPSYMMEPGEHYYSCKDCYQELFPYANERMRQRDFEQLRRIGYPVFYDNYDRCYRMWESTSLREDFGVYLKNGKLMRSMDSRYDIY